MWIVKIKTSDAIILHKLLLFHWLITCRMMWLLGQLTWLLTWRGQWGGLCPPGPQPSKLRGWQTLTRPDTLDTTWDQDTFHQNKTEKLFPEPGPHKLHVSLTAPVLVSWTVLTSQTPPDTVSNLSHTLWQPEMSRQTLSSTLVSYDHSYLMMVLLKVLVQRHFLMQARQKVWQQDDRMPNLRSDGFAFCTTTSIQMEQTWTTKTTELTNQSINRSINQGLFI